MTLVKVLNCDIEFQFVFEVGGEMKEPEIRSDLRKTNPFPFFESPAY